MCHTFSLFSLPVTALATRIPVENCSASLHNDNISVSGGSALELHGSPTASEEV